MRVGAHHSRWFFVLLPCCLLTCIHSIREGSMEAASEPPRPAEASAARRGNRSEALSPGACWARASPLPSLSGMESYIKRGFMVLLDGAPAGEASLHAWTQKDGSKVHRAESALVSPRDPSAYRHFEETVISKDGLFLFGEVRRLVGEETRALRACRVPGAIEIQLEDGSSRRLELTPNEQVWGQSAATAKLAFAGEPGDSLLVFDPGAGSLGKVTLTRRLEDGWVLIEDLGVPVRSRWAEGEELPLEVALLGVGLEYVSSAENREARAGTATDSTARRPARAALGLGPMRAGKLVRLEPPEAFPGLSCSNGLGRLSSFGPVCESVDAPLEGLLDEPGERVRQLVDSMPPGLCPESRARWLAREVSRRLSKEESSASLWEASPEHALLTGSGDCNEAAAIFMVAAPLADLEVRRRTGLIADEDGDERQRFLWPHAWIVVFLEGSWVRLDPILGELPAQGVYVDLGDGSSLSARVRTMSAAAMGGRVIVLEK